MSINLRLNIHRFLQNERTPMNYDALTDKAILEELGSRLQRERLNRNITQTDVATQAGVSRRAVQNMESGRPSTTTLLIRVLRALGKIDTLDSLLPEPGLSPIQLAKMKGRARIRAGGRHHRSLKRG
jgi:putative transcriptional regulator